MEKFNEIINGDLPVLVDFFAEWCAPCKAQAPILKQLAKEFDGKVRILKIDVDNNKAVAQKYGIRSIPTLIFFRKGEVVWQAAGMRQASELREIISK